jgi:hypothetical protein
VTITTLLPFHREAMTPAKVAPVFYLALYTGRT